MKRYIVLYAMLTFFLVANNNFDNTTNLINYARKFLGTKYQWGGTDPIRGIDCSAFVQRVVKQTTNINIPRTSNQQVQIGYPVNYGELEKGDLVFFKASKNRLPVDHVGIYIGSGFFIHSSSSCKGVAITPMEQFKKWYVTAKRLSAVNQSFASSFNPEIYNTPNTINNNSSEIPYQYIVNNNIPIKKKYVPFQAPKIKKTPKLLVNNYNKPLKGDF